MPLLDHLLLRLNKSQCFSEIILATSIDALDDDLVAWANCRNIKVYRGSLSNVFSRFFEASMNSQSTLFYRANGDSPFQNPSFINQSLKQLESSNSEFITGKSRFTQLPQGSLGEWITKDALIKISRLTLTPEEEEHVTLKIFNQPALLPWDFFKCNSAGSNTSLLVDYPKDLDFFQSIFQKSSINLSNVTHDELLKLLSRHKSL